MYEYKVIGTNMPYLEEELNTLSKKGWRVVSSFHSPSRLSPSIILERPKTGVVHD